MGSSLPLELLLLLATASPLAWYSLVRTFRPLSLYARYCPSFLSGLQREFSLPVSSEGETWYELPDGRKHGTWRLERGDRLVVAEYRFGLLSGPWREYESSLLRLSQTYLQGLRHGLKMAFDSSGKICWRLRYCFGLAMGREERLFRGGGRRTTDLWLGKENGSSRIFWPEGKLRYSEEKICGSRCWYDERGLLRRRVEMRGGKEEGRAEVFDGRGRLLSFDSFRSGRRHGRAVSYDPLLVGLYLRGEEVLSRLPAWDPEEGISWMAEISRIEKKEWAPEER